MDNRHAIDHSQLFNIMGSAAFIWNASSLSFSASPSLSEWNCSWRLQSWFWIYGLTVKHGYTHECEASHAHIVSVRSTTINVNKAFTILLHLS
jgi:hypothetical protein